MEKEKIDKIYPPLYLNENVLYCDYTTGKFNLILFIQGIDFKQIDKRAGSKKKLPFLPVCLGKRGNRY